MAGTNLLKKQLELARFEKTMEYIAVNAKGSKHLNQTELALINNMLTGSADSEPWRTSQTTVKLPFGREESFAMVSNPMLRGRDIIFEARDAAREGDVVKAASHLYAQLVLSHLFKEANRRTAVAACCWLLFENRIEVPSMGLLELGLGDLRKEGQMKILTDLISNTIQMHQNRKS